MNLFDITWNNYHISPEISISMRRAAITAVAVQAVLDSVDAEADKDVFHKIIHKKIIVYC